jgi:NAD-dependent dihydropyrimidine dehydrogenase PreA subunit
MVMIRVDEDKCSGCGECVDVCPVDVYILNDNKANPENMEECTECCSCVEVCPESCIDHEAC